MNPDSLSRRLLRRTAPVAAAAVIGAGTGAGVYALTSSHGGSDAASPQTVPTAIIPAQSAASTTTVSSLTKLYDQATPGVVDISVDATSTSDNFGFGPQHQQTRAEGSGFVLDSDGNILTNQHVVANANSIMVRFKDGSTAKAKLVGADEGTDIAVIKVDVAASKLHPLALGSSAGVRPGQSVVAIGSPYGLTETMTAGIVSAIQRTITAPNQFSLSGAIQTDAAINHGNSGGPLIDATTGKVIGVNAQIDSGSGDNSGVGFAIPIDTAKRVADSLIAGKQVQHAYLGVQIGDATDEAGAVVGCIVPDAPAGKAGLQSGDVITAVDGNPISGSDELTSALGSRLPGEIVTFTIDRRGATKSIQVTLGNQPSSPTRCQS
ncbi:MAG TPA: trypsin-like peptidase domain-containing protein [Gaiellaceae bacterium]|nr:trypsin-like peptidase domain-containing protein [Gaiellaceae bacterium]